MNREKTLLEERGGQVCPVVRARYVQILHMCVPTVYAGTAELGYSKVGGQQLEAGCSRVVVKYWFVVKKKNQR